MYRTNVHLSTLLIPLDKFGEALLIQAKFSDEKMRETVIVFEEFVHFSRT